MLAVYITSHGFGHATRTAEVLRVLRTHEPDIPITVVTTVPARIFEAIPGGVLLRRKAVDFGLAQRDALNIDEAETSRRWLAYAAGWDALVNDEAAWLRDEGARLVLGDIPPVAFAAAHAASIPSIALGNFSWDWIYAHYGGRQPVLLDAARTCAAAHAHVGQLLQLPFAGDMTSFPAREQLPLLARRTAIGREEARRRLGLGTAQTVILLSFGGIGFEGLHPNMLRSETEFHFLLEAEGDLPSNATALSDHKLAAYGLRYEDVVAVADVVVTKPGYGIVSDAIGAGTRVLYTDRGDFPECPIMVAEMPRYLACRHIERNALLSGRIASPIRALLAQPVPSPPNMDGAEVAALRLLERFASPAS
jgi:hypothetical protein